MLKEKKYKILILVYLIIYFLFSITFIDYAKITYYSLSYVFLNWGPESIGINDYFRMSCYILLFINMLFNIIIIINILRIKDIKLFSMIFCIIHCLICLLYYLAYYKILHHVLFSVISIFAIILYLYLYKKYKKHIYNIYKKPNVA
jgi:hypothetical protein